MRRIKIAVLPGDGIGKEVVPIATKILDAIAEVNGELIFEYTDYPWNCDYYQQTGRMMPENGLEMLREHDAIFLGAIGNSSIVPDHISLWELLLKIRKEFNQVLNIRPAKLLDGISSPLVNPKSFDLIVVRENSEGEYTEIGGRIKSGEDQIVIQNSVFTKKATEQAIRYAFKLAEKRKRHVTSATKSNGIYYSMPFWDEVFSEVKADYPNIIAKQMHIDALAASLVTKPHTFDVIVASNLFGDILTDIGAAIMGSIGVAPSANINLDGKYPSMFEPVHGSAPDIAGKGIANPIGQIWTAQMMLSHLGLSKIADRLLITLENTFKLGYLTPDVGGRYTTKEVGDKIVELIYKW